MQRQAVSNEEHLTLRLSSHPAAIGAGRSTPMGFMVKCCSLRTWSNAIAGSADNAHNASNPG